ncbi:Hypothetical predicted protein, partial [Drosophila guanche]
IQPRNHGVSSTSKDKTGRRLHPRGGRHITRKDKQLRRLHPRGGRHISREYEVKDDACIREAVVTSAETTRTSQDDACI